MRSRSHITTFLARVLLLSAKNDRKCPHHLIRVTRRATWPAFPIYFQSIEAMVTLPINTSSASSLHLLSSSPLTIKAKAPSAKPDILSILYEAATMDPPTANIASSHNHDGGMERSQKRTKRRLCQVRFDNKISGKKLAPFSAEERRGIYYNVSHHIRKKKRSDREVCANRPNSPTTPNNVCSHRFYSPSFTLNISTETRTRPY